MINFDDLPCKTEASNTPIPNGYAGLNWKNFYCYNAELAFGGNSGYKAGAVSPTNVAYNGYASSAEFTITAPGAAKFDFNSVYLTGAWNNGLKVTIEAWRDGTQVFNTTYILSATAPTQVTPNLSQIDSVRFSSAGGTPHESYEGVGTHFAMDNLDVDVAYVSPSVTAVPTLSEWSLMLMGLAAAGLGARRLRRG